MYFVDAIGDPVPSDTPTTYFNFEKEFLKGITTKSG